MNNLWRKFDIGRLDKLIFFPYSLLLILVIILLSLGQTMESYFWIDDNALIYKLQHLNENIGYWGKGIFGEGPYRHIVDQFILFYPFFRINPQPYFFVGLVLYFTAAVTLYFFVHHLTKKRSIALISSIIFGTGFIGLESILGITNSWQTSRGIIMALITFWLYFKYLKNQKFIYYFLSLILFFFSLDTVFIRAHGLIIALIFFDIVYSESWIGIQSIIKLLVRIAPFLIVYYTIYLSSLGYVQDLGLWKLFKDALETGKYYLLTIPIQDLGNLFIPDKLSVFIDMFLYKYFHLPLPDEFSLGSLASGFLFIFANLFLLLKFYKKENLIVKLLVFSFVWTCANFVGFYARESTHTLWSTHRYFSYSFIGVSIFWGCFFYFLNKTKFSKITTLFLVFIVFLFSFLSIKHQYIFNNDRNIPAKQLFKEFKASIPSMQKGSIVYFNIENDPLVSKRYGGFFGGMFSEGANYAIYYEGIDYMNDFLITYDFNDVTKNLKENKVSLDKVYSFYYDAKGLKNTTLDTRRLLLKKEEKELDISSLSSNNPYLNMGNIFESGTLFEKKGNGYFGANPTITLTPHGLSSLVPSRIIFELKVLPIIPQLPYLSNLSNLEINSKGKKEIYSFIISQYELEDIMEATAASYWKDQEPKLAIDGRLETSWRGHRGFWDDKSRGKAANIEYLQFDLKKEIEIGQVRWVSAQPPLVPIKYRYLGSLNGVNWKLLTTIERKEKLNPNTLITDEVKPEKIKFLRIEIESTYGNDGPEIKEVVLVEEKYKKIDFSILEKLKNQPFWEINNYDELVNAFNVVNKNSQVRFYYQSSIDEKQDSTKYMEIPINLDGEFQTINLDLPAMGENWVNFYIEGLNFPCRVYIKDIKFKYGI